MVRRILERCIDFLVLVRAVSASLLRLGKFVFFWQPLPPTAVNLQLENQKVNKKMYEVVNIESETSRTRWSHPVNGANRGGEHALSSSCPQDEEDDDGE